MSAREQCRTRSSATRLAALTLCLAPSTAHLLAPVSVAWYRSTDQAYHLAAAAMDVAGSRADRHARALLEALFAPSWHVPASPAAATTGPPRRGSVASVKSNKSLTTQPFKPSKPSSLAASASGQSSDEEPTQLEHDIDLEPAPAQRTPKGKTSQWEETDEDPIQHVLTCLQKVDLDEEDKIDDVRDRIEAAATRIAHQHGAGPLVRSSTPIHLRKSEHTDSQGNADCISTRCRRARLDAPAS